MNNKACSECDNFDPVLRGTKETKWGWCVEKSKYPASEGPGQVFPAKAKRVAPGELAEPCIVRKDQVIPSCNLYSAKKPRPSKAQLINTLLSSSSGKTVLK